MEESLDAVGVGAGERLQLSSYVGKWNRHVLEHCFEKNLFRLKIEIHRSLGHSDPSSDIFDAGCHIAVSNELLKSGVQDLQRPCSLSLRAHPERFFLRHFPSDKHSNADEKLSH